MTDREGFTLPTTSYASQAMCPYCDSSIELEPGVLDEVWCEGGHFFTIAGEVEDQVTLIPDLTRSSSIPTASSYKDPDYVIREDEDALCPKCGEDLVGRGEDLEGLLKGHDNTVIECVKGHEWQVYFRNGGDLYLFYFEDDGLFTTY